MASGRKNVPMYVKICSKHESQLREWKVKGKSRQHGAESPFRAKQKLAAVMSRI